MKYEFHKTQVVVNVAKKFGIENSEWNDYNDNIEAIKEKNLKIYNDIVCYFNAYDELYDYLEITDGKDPQKRFELSKIKGDLRISLIKSINNIDSFNCSNLK